MPGCEATIAALRQLAAASREGSFEALVARLLAQLIRVPIRRAHAGSQEGKDALSDDGGIAIECKRYGERTPLNARLLISELEEARQRHPNLQLWVLATTTALGPNEKEKLHQAAYGKGLAVLCLDTASTGPFLKSVDAINALCATHIETTLEFFSDLSKATRQKIRSELETIRGCPDFEAWSKWLTEEVRNRLPIWRFVVERQNLALVRQIRATASTSFGTGYDTAQAVPRKARIQLDRWFREALEAQSPTPPPIAVVLGERYDGKTWLVYQWLLDIAEKSEVPIFFVGSGRGIQSNRRLIDIQIEDLAQALQEARVHVEAFVHHFRDQNVAKTPWAVVVLDGLNEYAPNHLAWLRHLETSLGRGEANCRPAALIVTVRERAWEELKGLLRDSEPVQIDGMAGQGSHPNQLQFLEISLGPFDDGEFKEALERWKLPSNFLESLPQSASALAKRPRYLGLLVEHFNRLGDYAAVTAEVLHWLDLCDKVRRSQKGLEDWSPEQYQGILRNLAQHWLAERFLDEAGVREILNALTTNATRVLADLRSEGVLSGELGNYTVESSRLTMGYGLFLRDVLIRASRQKEDLKEALASWLAPLVDGDEAVDALRAAATLMLLEVAAARGSGTLREAIEVLDTLLGNWLDSRNLGRQDLEAIYELRRLLFEPLLRSWRIIWSEARSRSRTREISVLVFGEVVKSGGEAKDRLRKAVQEWFHMVPLNGSWYLRARIKTELQAETEDAAVKAAVESHLNRQIAQPLLGHLGFQLIEGLDIPGLQTMGLYLLGRAPDLVTPEDLLALTVVRVISEERIGSGDYWIIRQALENTPTLWFDHESSQCIGDLTNSLRKALLELSRIADRADLEMVSERLRGSDAADQKGVDGWPTRRNYKVLIQRSLKSSAELRRFAGNARTLLADPSLPQPTKVQRLALDRALRKGSSDKAGANSELILRDLEILSPAIAFWAPALGKEVIGQLLRATCDRIKKGESLFLLELRGHAALANGKVRKLLHQALDLSLRKKGDQWSIQQRELTLALLPAATLLETVALLVNRHEKFEHKETFELAGAFRIASDRKALINALEKTRSPRVLRRLRFLLAAAGCSPTLPVREIKAIGRTLGSSSALDVTAALHLAIQGQVEIDLEVLLQIARGRLNGETYARDYASYLLVKFFDHGQIENSLSPFWRAKSAARNSETARAYLDGVSADLARYEADRGCVSGQWVERDLPFEILPYLDAERVEKWTRAFVSWDGAGWRWWGGLLRPTFDWCLLNASESSRALWPLLYPFQRQRFGGGSRLSIDGVDSVLHALSCSENDDRMTRCFLAELLLDARTDFEIFEIALGARFQEGHRLRDLAQELASDSRAETRARAVAILGWLVEGKEQLEALQRQDPSLWVQKQAEIALERHTIEAWAKSWLDKFLETKGATNRWAAGRLFLECADQRIDTWAWGRVREGQFVRRVKREAVLLLRAAEERTKSQADQLKATLLGCRVDGLSIVAHPWRRDDEWILGRFGRRD